MRSTSSSDFFSRGNSGNQQPLNTNAYRVNRERAFPSSSKLGFAGFLRRIAQGGYQIWISMKYRIFKSTSRESSGFRIPWLQIGLAALVLFILTQKDVQFSVNMKAPAGMGDRESRQPVSRRGPDELGIAQTIALSNKEKKTASHFSPAQLDQEKAQVYIKRFSKVAIVEMEKFGIPASIKMAQGLLESRAGVNAESAGSNNHFGQPLSYRNYESAWENWRAHSLLLRESYPDLFTRGANYKKWAKGLQEAGYSGEKDYARKLMDIIERFQLYLLDEG